jgi:uncharacterized membrane protein YeaQ/YmgE (transglycosylase-associated protein family)
MSVETLILILAVGVVAGWLAGQIVRGGGFGFVGDLVVGILGAFIGSWLLPRLAVSRLRLRVAENGADDGKAHAGGFEQRCVGMP